MMGKLILVLLLCGAVAAFVWYAWSPAALPPIAGTYLCGGHDPVVIISKNTDGSLKFEDRGHTSVQTLIVPHPNGFRLFYTYSEPFPQDVNPDLLYPDPKTGKKKWIPEGGFRPSPTIPGDWDLVEFYPAANFHAVRGINDAVVFKRPLPSFLHRIDDPRVKDFYTHYLQANGRPNNPSAADLPRLAQSIIDAHPSDIFLRKLLLAGLIKAGDTKSLAAEAERDRPQMETNSLLKQYLDAADYALRAKALSEAHKNGWEQVRAFQQRDTRLNFQQQLQLLPELLKYETCMDPQGGLPFFELPNYLEVQTSAKVYGTVWVAFLLLQGQRDQAALYSAAVYHLGQLMQSGHPPVIGHLIGVAIRAIAARGMELVYLNAFETPAELEKYWALLEKLNQAEPPNFTEADIVSLEFHWIPEEERQALISKSPFNFNEAINRMKVAGSKFQLVRMGAAARDHQLRTGSLPSSNAEFDPLLPAGPPADPFTSAPLKMTDFAGGITCYSVGPDLVDDGGTIVYDPSNGTKSRGDVTLEIPARRRYPFPAAGVRANTVAELLLQFPNGLPPDPFADRKGTPLGVSNTLPVCVYSYGPDCDQAEALPHPQVQYDPTNGTASRGDLIMQIPRR